jgi:hypothetical protein
MTTVTIVQERDERGELSFRATSWDREAAGKTPGAAFDAFAADMPAHERGTIAIVQEFRPDEFFSATQQARLSELMTRWRAARDSNSTLPTEEQTELDRLIAAELNAATKRSKALRGSLGR